MQTLPISPTREAQPCPSPVVVWKQLLTHLFERHYGLRLNDTPFHYESVIQEHIESGISLKDAVNFVVERYGLLRIDRSGFSFHESTPFINFTDIFRARRATGLMNN